MEPIRLKDIKVLLIDDDEDDYLIIKSIFKQIPHSPFVLDWTASYQSAKQQIEQGHHDIYLIDYRLGAHSGLDLLKFASPKERPQPFILLTGAGDPTIEWRSMELAAADYLVKGSFDANILSRTLYHALQRKRIEEQRIKQLVELNRSKDEFISIASHQLRTPATAVKQYVGMLLEGFFGELPHDQHEILKKAYDSNERQLRIVTDLLKVAQIDAGKITLNKRPWSINQMVSEVVRELASTAKKRQQTIEYQAAKDDIIAEFDPDNIRMVLENLLDNASKYSEENRVIRVMVDEDESEVRIHVIDEGVGINPRQAGHLFEKFSRLDNSLSAKVSGTGLGLYWAKKVVDLHGGLLSYTNNDEAGTIFTVSLPKKADLQ